MKYESSELLQQLAAEYAVGTLEGGARQRFERILESSEEARWHLTFWEQRLAEFGEKLEPEAPPAELRNILLSKADHLARAEQNVPSIHQSRSRRRRSIFGRSRLIRAYASGAATAAVVMLAVFLVQDRLNQGSEAPLNITQPLSVPAAVTSASSPTTPNSSADSVASAPDGTKRKPKRRGPEIREAFPIYAAQLKLPSSSMTWLISISPDRSDLSVVAGEDLYQVGRHQLVLWCVIPGQEPAAIGVMPFQRDVTTRFRIPEILRGRDDVSFAVSLEPQTGPKGGKPFGGSFLSAAKSLDSI